MGFFSSLFGTSSSAYNLSNVEHELTQQEIKLLISKSYISTLDKGQEMMIEEAIMARRRGDGHISVRQVNEVLLQLQNQHKISQYDRQGVVRVVQDFFRQKFGN